MGVKRKCLPIHRIYATRRSAPALPTLVYVDTKPPGRQSGPGRHNGPVTVIPSGGQLRPAVSKEDCPVPTYCAGVTGDPDVRRRKMVAPP